MDYKDEEYTSIRSMLMRLSSVSPQAALNTEAKAHSEAETRLSGFWLIVARVIWASLIVLVLAYFLASIPAYFAQLQTVCVHSVCAHWQLTWGNLMALRKAGLSIGLYAIFNLALSLCSVCVWLAVAGFIAWHKS